MKILNMVIPTLMHLCSFISNWSVASHMKPTTSYKMIFWLFVVKVPLTEEVATPLVALLKSHNQEIQKASTLAISNFAISGPGMY